MPNSSAPTQERRFTQSDLALLEVRATDSAENPSKIGGYAAMFNMMSQPLMDFYGPLFREKIAPGAFTNAIKNDDVRGLWNHDANWVLGRNKSGTLTLNEDAKGLAFEVTPPDAQWARDLLVSIGRRDVNQCSFAFQVVRDQWETERDPESGKRTGTVRTLLEVRLFDVSVVTYPAYTDTSAQLRSLTASLRSAPRDVIEETIEILGTLRAAARESGDDVQTVDVDQLRRRLELKAKAL
jgi:uncharacterized protein